jgi:hypothetical protein
MANNRTKAWERRQANGRITAVRNRRRVLILCEDEKSGRLYFEGFRLDKRRVEVLPIGTGMNTDSLVQKAIDLKEKEARSGEPFNKIWCVFDRDSFPPQNFNRAFQLAESNNISVVWANEAFEIWYLLRFNYHDTGMSRADYRGRLSNLLQYDYDKADDQIFARLESRQSTALKNSRRLEKHWVDLGRRWTPENANPSTNIHKLVEFLNEFKEIGLADAD